MIRNFSDFCDALLDCGFSLGGGDSKGIYALIGRSWDAPVPPDDPIRWHTGDPETDPWEWRMRVLNERQDIAYGKVFFKVSGFITRDWYGDFLAVRRSGESFETLYDKGLLSHAAKRIYTLLNENGPLPLHDVKRIGGFRQDEKSAFDRAVTELQMRMFITLSGCRQKRNQLGLEYGWHSTMLATVEQFWGERGVTFASADPGEAYDRIKAQVLRLNPMAEPRKIDKFIRG